MIRPMVLDISDSHRFAELGFLAPNVESEMWSHS